MVAITDHQRQVLVEHALESNHEGPFEEAEARFVDVIADLATGRAVEDRTLFIAFLWQRVTVALNAGASRKAHWVWSAAVQVLDLLGEDLEDIFSGRPRPPLPRLQPASTAPLPPP